jgi:hypothetical protein
MFRQLEWRLTASKHAKLKYETIFFGVTTWKIMKEM